MKKIMWALILLLVCILAGCQKKSAENAEYLVYYANAEGTRLVTRSCDIQATAADEILAEMFERMKMPQTGSGETSLLPDNVELEDYNLTDGQLTLTFGNEYKQMNNIKEILLRAGMVKMTTQVDGVRTVVFHIGDGVLTDSDGEPVGAMTSSMFINNPVGINSYQYVSMTLYFANETGDKLVREIRNVHYSSNTTLEKVVMEQLLKGPMDADLNPVLPDGTTVLSITKEDGLCTVNLNRAFLETAVVPAVTCEVELYAMVNTLCDVLNVDRVQFQIEGDSKVMFGGTLNLSGPFHRNSELIEVTDEGDDEPASLAEPSIGV